MMVRLESKQTQLSVVLDISHSPSIRRVVVSRKAGHKT